ncbi:MAG: PD40 domain-containing protein, partial [Planctomycetes bacterium]|nr:PD40 domain-containing protein [Planctomycetota bacterium]
MAIREGTRRWLLRLAWAGLIASLSLWLGLWLGRPLYYTDGVQQLRADELQADGMLRWSPPEVVAELPGRVSGRVAQLPDGRLCYGRLQPDGTSDLVVFDPRLPQNAPEPAYGLNSAHNELAPALGPDGVLYFASDRPGGFGGYDLYASRLERGGFAPPVPLAAINTARDETDPAPSPDGSTLVFVRIDEEQRGPDDGRLFRFALGGELDAVPLFEEPLGQRQARRADRDPAFSADGAELWFVRKALGEPAQLLRVSVHQGQWDRVRPANAHWGLGAVRAPSPSADGLHLYVLQPGRGEDASDLWYVSTASEVHPFWLGQRWLEWLLLGVALTCLLLLVLLYLGRRWTALDLLVQCLLLSLLLHLLLFLWLMGVEITGALLPGDDAGAGLEVSIVTSSSAAGGGGADGQVQQDLAAMVRFEGRENAIAAAAPGAALEKANASEALSGPEAELREASSAGGSEVAAPATSMQDAAAAASLRDGAAVQQAVDAAPLPTVASSADAAAAAASPERARAGASEAGIVVQAPGANLAAAAFSGSGALAASAPSPAVPSARSVAVAQSAVSDAAPTYAPPGAER